MMTESRRDANLFVGLDVGGTKVHGILLGPGDGVLDEVRMATSPGSGRRRSISR